MKGGLHLDDKISDGSATADGMTPRLFDLDFQLLADAVLHYCSIRSVPGPVLFPV